MSDISEVGEAKQIRILYDEADWLEKLKLVPQEPWYKVLARVHTEYEAMKKDARVYRELIGKRDKHDNKPQQPPQETVTRTEKENQE